MLTTEQKQLLRGIQNREISGKSGKPDNLMRERHGLPHATADDVTRTRRAALRLSQRKNKKGWIGLGQLH